MVRFIIEVSDGYIHERADMSNIEESEGSFQKKMVEMITFMHVEHELDKGVNEFVVSSKDIADDNLRKIFNDTVTSCAVIKSALSLEKELK